MGFLVVSSMPLLEKRIALENFSNRWVVQEDENFLDKRTSIGHNQEYLPQIYRTGYKYQSEYNNSLYSSVYSFANSSSYVYISDYTFKPVFLEGSGIIDINKAYSPIYEMDIKVENDSLIQMPLFYYPGYEVTITNIENNESYTLKPIDIDGLIAFNLETGNYKVSTNYEGTTLRKASTCVFAISISITSLALLYGLFIENDKYKKYFKIEKNKMSKVDK